MRWIDIASQGYEAALEAVQRVLPESDPAVADTVRLIIADVRARGDAALLDLGRRFDAPLLSGLAVPEDELERGASSTPRSLRDALERAFMSIRLFHEAQTRSSWMRHGTGTVTGQLIRPLDRVGIYVPGGRARYPSSVLMCGVPALVAGVPDIRICTPAGSDGSVHPSVLYAARLIGARAVYRIGGAQAVAAMAYGTETVARVDKVVGPGNVYVCEAKRALWGVVDMDMLAGPSEVCVVADATADPAFVAADLITQAEHDPECAVFLLTPHRELADATMREVEAQLTSLERAPTIRAVLEKNGVVVVTRSVEEAIELANACAPEHLALMVRDAFSYLGNVRNAGAVMLGHTTPQTVGDYIAGPSHTLPTGGSARFWSPLNVDTFLKKTSFMSYNAQALRAAAPTLTEMASAEGLDGHAAAVSARTASDSASGLER